MDNYIIVAILVLIAVIALGTLVKRAGRKGCCGSAGDYKPRKKKLQSVSAIRTFRVEGMHCEKCSNRVTEAVNDLPGVAASVDLKKGIVTVFYEQKVPDEQIKARIERRGYLVTEIRE